MYTKRMADDNVAMRQRAKMLLQTGTIGDPDHIDLVVEIIQAKFPDVELHRVKRRVNDVRMSLRKPR